jgi:ATP-binding cassette, subfamily B, bacterial
VLFRAFPGEASALAVLAALTGVLPAVFAALVGRLVGQVPAAVRAGANQESARHLAGTLIAMAVVLVGLELVAGAREMISTDLYRRFDGYLLGRVMASALRREDLQLADDPGLAAMVDRALRAARYRPGELVSGLSSQWTARAQGLAALLLGAHVVVLALLAGSASSGALPAAAVAVIVQGLFGMAMIASRNGDIWIENGAVPVPDVLALEQAVQPGRSGGASACGLPRESITFRGVQFSYPSGNKAILAGLDLDIRAGTSLAIVGLNGAGKTTLVKLLAGLCEPTAGSITVDGTPLTELDRISWWRQLAVLFQDFVRYELPLRDNVGFGSVEHAWDDQAIWEAAAMAGAEDLVAALPAGQATTLSPRFEGGVDVSGGQWQRIAFARALLAVRAGARVLVLDEPTAHLDVRAEAEMFDRFIELTKGLTTIVISHRFSTVRRADRIIVLEHGQITEDGSHEELLAAGGRYERLFRLQASSYGGTDD